MEEAKFRLTGIGPQMMNNGQMANRLNPFAKKVAEYTKRASQLSEEETFEKYRFQWEGALYLNPESNVPGWPSENVMGCLTQGAKRSKLGKHVERGVMESKPFFDLVYDGPKDVESMWKDGHFADIRNVRMGSGAQKSTVQKARPIFNGWSLEVGLLVDTKEISIEDVGRCFVDAGMYIGLSDYRPRYGRFTVDSM